MQDLITFATQVQHMRTAQQDYFTKIAKAKKTKLPGDFAASTNALKHSKQLEESVDTATQQILKDQPVFP